MPFTEPQSFQVTVTMDDILASAVMLANGSNIYVNSLAKCLNRLNQTKQLPGLENDSAPQEGCIFYASNEVRLNNGQFLSVCDVYVCSAVYSADAAATLKILLENVAGTKPSAPYVVTLSKA